ANPYFFQRLTGNHKRLACFFFSRNTIRARLHSWRISNMRAIDDNESLGLSDIQFAWLYRFIGIGIRRAMSRRMKTSQVPAKDPTSVIRRGGLVALIVFSCLAYGAAPAEA